jgi:tripeptidyl-peptidase I
LITSGGGFSVFAPAPAWQKSAIATYLASGALLPPAGDFNATGRGYPDVSALGHNYIIWADGAPLQVDGTSCSAPVWGAVLGLVNAARLNAGKKVVGFVNPAIYQVVCFYSLF